jgi:hypothetical protein
MDEASEVILLTLQLTAIRKRVFYGIKRLGKGKD